MNRLASATSPYLRQHKDNPVDWWPWIPEAFEEAKRRNVPIHLSIGYAACHWCHVMARESFSNNSIADQLNSNFVSIKVDREERPEVDQIYMKALHALGQQGGWPLTMFLRPDGKPFWGGTYFPPEPRYGRPGFPQVLDAVSSAWKGGDPSIRQNAEALTLHLSQPTPRSPTLEMGRSPDPRVLDEAARKILAIWDMERGSFRGAPKFPNAPAQDVLWRSFLRTGDTSFRDAVITTLTHTCQGGIYDHVGGGFARYAVDANWLVPHFEKMLYDNGLLLSLLSFAFRETKSPLFRARIDETVTWLGREMLMPGGGLASSLDADTEHEEGLTYVWTWPELEQALGARAGSFARVYGASLEGSWEGKIILNRLSPAALDWLGDGPEETYRRQRGELLRIRNRRPQPSRDDKILSDWNGLAISGLARAAQATGNPDASQLSQQAFRFVSDSMGEGDRLAHSFMEGELVRPGLATDYANMIRAAIDLFALTGEASMATRATEWFDAARRHHFDPESGIYRLAADDAPPLIAPSESVADEATPAATGVMASNAASLFMLTGEPAYQTHADELVSGITERVSDDPISTASLQAGFDTLLRQRLAFAVGTAVGSDQLATTAIGEPDPALILAAVDPATLPANHPAAGKQPSSAEAALFVCNAFSCLPEITSSAEVKRVMTATRTGLG